LTQRAAARQFGVTTYDYRRMEAGEIDPPAGKAVPRVGKLSLNERCLLRRVRSGLTVGALVSRSGFSRCWVQNVERGRANPESLARFWAGEKQ
jgi:predicted transcriptional regulator